MHKNTNRLFHLKVSSGTPDFAQGLAMAFAAALLGSQVSTQIFMKARTLFAPVSVTLTSGGLILDSLSEQYAWISTARFLGAGTGVSTTEFLSADTMQMTPTKAIARKEVSRDTVLRPQVISHPARTSIDRVSARRSEKMMKRVATPILNTESENKNLPLAGSVSSPTRELSALHQLRVSIQKAREAYLSGADYSNAQVVAAFEQKLKSSDAETFVGELFPAIPIAIDFPILKIDSLRLVASRTTHFSEVRKALTRGKIVRRTSHSEKIGKNVSFNQLPVQTNALALNADELRASANPNPSVVSRPAHLQSIPVPSAPVKLEPINLLSFFKRSERLNELDRNVTTQFKSEPSEVTAPHRQVRSETISSSLLEKTKTVGLTTWSRVKTWASTVHLPSVSRISQSTPSVKPLAQMNSQPTQIPAEAMANQVNTQKSNHSSPVNSDEAASISVSTAGDSAEEVEEVGTPEADSIVNDVAQPLAVEAFDWKNAILGAELSTLAFEGFAGASTARWGIVRAADHWATLTYKRFNGTSSVPLLSKNTILLLSNLAKEHQADTAGLVFGRVPKGWSVELSEHRNQAVYVTEDKKAFFDKTYTSEVSNSQDRYFVFLNAAPGTKLIYMTQTGSKETAVLPLPVQSGQATFLDLPKPEKRSVTLKFRDAASPEKKSEGNITVWPEGQSELHTIKTDSVGRGTLSNVYTIPGHALIINAVSSTGVTHRYSLNDYALRGRGGVKPSEIDLYVFSFRHISTWKRQLEGGLSTQSGIIVAAYPGVSENELIDKRYPALTPVTAGATLIPETYTLSNKETLEVKSPLEVGVPRSLSVHVPNGPVVLELQRDGGTITWSQIIYSSPDVVNVVLAE